MFTKVDTKENDKVVGLFEACDVENCLDLDNFQFNKNFSYHSFGKYPFVRLLLKSEDTELFRANDSEIEWEIAINLKSKVDDNSIIISSMPNIAVQNSLYADLK